MTFKILMAFSLFALIATSSPGPSNMLVLASGANVGFRRSIPLIFGFAGGVSSLFLCVGLGLGAVFQAFPWLYDILRYVGAGYLGYLAWRISQSGPISTAENTGSTLGFFGGTVFQWVNPKSWVVSISAIATYVPQQQFMLNVAIVASIFLIIATFSTGLWAAFGSGLRAFLSDSKTARLFNYAMAAALVFSIIPILTS